MTVSKVRINQRTKQELGQAGINEMCRHLYAVDCQTCGRSLGVRPPAVTVDDYGINAHAQLHHESCRKPRWTERTAVVDDLSKPATLTYRPHAVLPRYEVFPDMGLDVPILLLNPGLEAATLRRGEEGWRVCTVERYVSYGLQVASIEQRVDTVAGAYVAVGGADDVSDPVLSVYIDPMRQWTTSTQHFIAHAAIRQRGLVLLVTSALDPAKLITGTFDVPELFALIDSGQCAAGWFPLRGAGR